MSYRVVNGRAVSGLRGLGDGTCQWPQPGVKMFYPPCAGANPIASITSYPDPNVIPADSGAPPAGQYVAPDLLTPYEGRVDQFGNFYCVDETGRRMPAGFDCERKNMEILLANTQSRTDANLAVVRQNCERDWAMNADRFRSLGMAVPANDCAFRTYSLLPAGSAPGYIAGTPQSIIDHVPAEPAKASAPAAAAGAPAAAAPAATTPAAAAVVSGSNYVLTAAADAAKGLGVSPAVLLGAAGLAALFFFGGRR